MTKNYHLTLSVYMVIILSIPKTKRNTGSRLYMLSFSYNTQGYQWFSF